MSTRRNKPFRNVVLWSFLLSLLLHGTLVLIKFTESQIPFDPNSISSSDPIELTEIPPELLQPPPSQQKQVRSRAKQIVETEKLDNEELDPNSRFLGEKSQRAEKQMRAKSVDDFREKQGTGLKSAQQGQQDATPPTGEKTQSEETDEIANSDTGEPMPAGKRAGIKRDWKKLSLKDLSVGGDGAPMGATDDMLEDIAAGERTILSTREFRYFSYYHRIKLLLRQFWKPNVERRLVRMWNKGQPIRGGEMITRLLVLLDEKGSIQKISRLATSGTTEVDDAAEEAFRQAAPFPNPPKGIVDADGFVRIRWDFILQTAATPRIQFKRVGGPNGRP